MWNTAHNIMLGLTLCLEIMQVHLQTVNLAIARSHEEHEINKGMKIRRIRYDKQTNKTIVEGMKMIR